MEHFCTKFVSEYGAARRGVVWYAQITLSDWFDLEEYVCSIYVIDTSL